MKILVIMDLIVMIVITMERLNILSIYAQDLKETSKHTEKTGRKEYRIMTNKVFLIENTDADEFEKDIDSCLSDIGYMNLIDIKYETHIYGNRIHRSALIIYKEDK